MAQEPVFNEYELTLKPGTNKDNFLDRFTAWLESHPDQDETSYLVEQGRKDPDKPCFACTEDFLQKAKTAFAAQIETTALVTADVGLGVAQSPGAATPAAALKTRKP